MAHLSGYTGSLTYSTPASNVLFSPTDASVILQSWTVTQTTDTHEAIAKGDIGVTTFPMASRWTGTATYLQQDTVAAANDGDLAIREDSTGKAIAVSFVTDTGDSYDGTGFVTSISTDDPLDGPVTVTVEFTGNGILAQTGTAP